MSGYWNSTPKGTWTISDATDALECLRDSETRARLDQKNRRINAVGPFGKAVIIDLQSILVTFTDDEKVDFINKVENVLGEKFSIV